MNPTIIKEQRTPPQEANAITHTTPRELESHGFFLAPLLQPGFDVLDAGCGQGTITTDIAQAAFPGRVTGMDATPARLDQGRRLAEGREILNIGFVAGSACEMPFADHSFDVVFSHGLLEHLHNPGQAMKEFHRVLRPGGFIALCSPDWSAFQHTPHSMNVGRAINAFRHLQERNGTDLYTGARLPEYLTAAGFTPLAHDGWIEECEDTCEMAAHMIQKLDKAGQFHHATVLRDWMKTPSARFRQTWRYATGVRADEHTAHSRLWE